MVVLLQTSSRSSGRSFPGDVSLWICTCVLSAPLSRWRCKCSRSWSQLPLKIAQGWRGFTHGRSFSLRSSWCACSLGNGGLLLCLRTAHLVESRVIFRRVVVSCSSRRGQTQTCNSGSFFLCSFPSSTPSAASNWLLSPSTVAEACGGCASKASIRDSCVGARTQTFGRASYLDLSTPNQDRPKHSATTSSGDPGALRRSRAERCQVHPSASSPRYHVRSVDGVLPPCALHRGHHQVVLSRLVTGVLPVERGAHLRSKPFTFRVYFLLDVLEFLRTFSLHCLHLFEDTLQVCGSS